MRLIYKQSGEEVKVGDPICLSRGEEGKVTYFREPHKAASSGKVTVRMNGSDYDEEYFVGIINAHWVDRGGR